MNKTTTLSPALVEVCTLLSLGLVTNIAVAFCYGLFVVRYDPPLGKHLVTLFKGDSSRIVRYIVNSFVG